MQSLQNNALGNAGILGRRLSLEPHQGVVDLQKRFANPEDAWRSIGMDLEDPALKRVVPSFPSAPETLKLFQDPRPEQSSDSRIFGCS